MEKDTLYEFPELSDGKLLTNDGSAFEIHRIILVRKSEYFQAMFCGINRDKTEFTIPGISGDCLRYILYYIYTGDIRVTEKNVADLLIATDYLLLKDLYLVIKEGLASYMKYCNCLKILKVAGALRDKEIYEDCFRFIETRFEQLLHGNKEGIADLPLEILEVFLSSHSLFVLSERTVWQAIVKWTENDVPYRSSHVPRLLRSLAIEEVEEDLATEILQHEIITKNDAFLKDLNAAKSSNDFTNNIQIFSNLLCNCSLYTSELCNLRIPRNIIIVCLKNNMYVTYDENPDLWRKISELDFQPDILRVIGRNIYTFKLHPEGGDGTGARTIICKNFDLNRMDWVPMENCKNHYTCPYIVTIDYYIYILGSLENWSYDVVVYDTETDRWFYGRPLREITIEVAVCIEKKIYVIGSCANIDRYKMYVFDSVSIEWSFLSLPNIIYRDDFALVECRRKLYLIVGTQEDNEVYDPARNDWKKLPAVPHTYFSVGAIVLNDQIFVYDRRSISRKICRWTFEKEYWEEVKKPWHLERFITLAAFCTIDDNETIKMMTKRNRDPKSEFQSTHLKLHN